MSQSNFSTRINLDSNTLSAKQILTFELSDRNFDFVKSLVGNTPFNIVVYIGNIDTSNFDFKLDDYFIDEEVEIRIEHNLANMNYPLLINNEKDFFEFLKNCILPLKIIDIKKINNTLKVKISEGALKKVQLKANLSVLCNDKNYVDKKAIILPEILPNEYLEKFSKNILISFIDIISERKFDKNEYLIKVGNISTLLIPENIVFSKDNVEMIYFIVKFIFDDTNRYEDKLQILRKVLTNYLNQNKDVENINWNTILQTLKDNYSLFIDNKIDAFIEIEQELYNQQKIISEDITKDINNKIEELSKQLLTILATIITSFILKIDDGQNLWVLGLAILYSCTLLIMNVIKGFHFSSQNIKHRKEKIKESLSRVVGIEKLEKFDLDSNAILKKLWLLEEIQKFFLVLMVIALVVSFIIA